jgi:hypothetical protein
VRDPKDWEGGNRDSSLGFARDHKLQSYRLLYTVYVTYPEQPLGFVPHTLLDPNSMCRVRTIEQGSKAIRAGAASQSTYI